MKSQTVNYIAAAIFSIISLFHLFRLVFGWEAIIAGLVVPLWISGFGALIAGTLAVLMWRS